MSASTMFRFGTRLRASYNNALQVTTVPLRSTAVPERRRLQTRQAKAVAQIMTLDRQFMAGYCLSRASSWPRSIKRL
jgi:hypothetical protein